MAGLNGRRKRRVKAETELQFGPQEDNLSLALQDAASTRDTTIRGARGSAAAQVRAAHQASPALRRALKAPRAEIGAASSKLATDLLGNTSAAAAGAPRDVAVTKGILADILAQGLSENTARARDAKAGQAYAVANARSQFSTARSRVRAQQGSLARQEGLYATTQYDDLTDAARERAIKRSSQRIAQQNADTSAGSLREKTRHDKAVEAGKNKNKPQVAKPAAVDKYHASLNAALVDAQRMKAAGRHRPEVKQILSTGRESQTLKNDENGNPLANPVKIPAVHQVKSQAIAAAAMDMAYQGYISGNTVHMLAALGIKPAQLNLPTQPRTAPPLPRPRPLPSGMGALGRGSGGLGLLPSRPTG